MLKWLGRLILLGILVFVFLGVFAYFNLKATQPPGIDKASYAVQAYYDQDGMKIPTRYYYAEKVEINDGIAILSGYWTYDGEKYRKQTGEKAVNPPFDIIRRLK